MACNIKVYLEFAWILTFIHATSCLNLGLISGDLRRTSNPLIIKKHSHHSPITINIKHGLPKPLLPPLPRKLSSRPSVLKTKLKSRLKSAIRSKKLKLPKLPKLPLIPKLPLLPLPLLPLPLLPPVLPRLPKLKPLRIPILKKSKLQKALGSELKPVKVPVPNAQAKKLILDKLVKLRKSGSLTTPEFLRFKKILL